MILNKIKCKYCSSTNVVKYGTHEGVQRYWCKDCKRKFADNDALPEMKTPIKVIASALSCYFGGMPLDAIQRHLQQQFGIYYSEMGIYNWVKRFAKEAIDRVKDFQPIVGDTWIADETMLKVGGKNVWFFDVIDEKSRYLLASRLAESRTIKETALVMKEAQRRAGKSPKRIITDRMTAYPDGIEPIMDFDLGTFAGWIEVMKPQFVSIGADSKGHNLPEPSPDNLLRLIDEISKTTTLLNLPGDNLYFFIYIPHFNNSLSTLVLFLLCLSQNSRNVHALNVFTWFAQATNCRYSSVSWVFLCLIMYGIHPSSLRILHRNKSWGNVVLYPTKT